MSIIANGKQTIIKPAVKQQQLRTMPPTNYPPLERLNWLIHLQHVQGEINVCKELIREEIDKSKGRNEYAFFKQGTILREEGKIQEALESFQTCMRLNPENLDNVKEVAKCLFLLRRYRLSLEAYMEAESMAERPDWEVLHNIGQCLMRLGDVGKAKEYAKKAVQVGRHECSYSLLMRILIAEGDVRSAIAVCNAAVEACPDSVNMLTESGLLYLKSGQTQHAFERLSAALALESACAKALLGIGCITQMHEEYDVALTKYKIALQSEPTSVALWNNIGVCFYSKQKYIAAISCLKRALWLSPLDWKVLSNLGLVHMSTGQQASGFNFLCAAVNLRPEVGRTFMMLGCSLLEMNDPENALRAFKQATRLTPEDPIVLLNSTTCLLNCGMRHEAEELLSRCRDLQEAGKMVGVNEEFVELETRLRTILNVSTENQPENVDRMLEGTADDHQVNEKEINDVQDEPIHPLGHEMGEDEV